MADDTNAAPAGAGEQTTTPELGPLSISAAAQRFADWDNDEPEAPAEADQGTDDTNIENTPSDDAPADEPAEQTEETDAEEAPDPAPEAEPDATDDESNQFAHGNMRTRLRDGTVTTIGELKKLADEARELRAKAPELTAATEKVQQYQAREAHIAQQEQHLQTILPLALQQLQAQIPQAPNPALIDPNSSEYDPIRFVQENEQHKLALGRLQQMQTSIQQQQIQQQQQQEQARAADNQRLLEENRRALYERIPEIADPAKRSVVYNSVVEAVNKYGITKDEVDRNPDARLVHMIHDLSKKAAAYDTLMSQKQAAQKKVERAAPVQQPGRRVPQAETQARADEKLIQRARQRGGRIEDMAALFSQF